MNNITEDYVSFETAKLLRQLGFDEYCTAFYYEDGSFYDQIGNYNQTEWNVKKPHYSAAEHWQVLKWLRIKHGIHIWIENNAFGYYWFTNNASKPPWNKDMRAWQFHPTLPHLSVGGNEYELAEDAIEAAILHTLNNLI